MTDTPSTTATIFYTFTATYSFENAGTTFAITVTPTRDWIGPTGTTLTTTFSTIPSSDGMWPTNTVFQDYVLAIATGAASASFLCDGPGCESTVTRSTNSKTTLSSASTDATQKGPQMAHSGPESTSDPFSSSSEESDLSTTSTSQEPTQSVSGNTTSIWMTTSTLRTISSAPTSTTTPNLAASNNTSPPPDSSKTSHKPMTAIIALASALGGALLGILIYRLCILFHRRRKQSKNQDLCWRNTPSDDGYIGTTASETLVGNDEVPATESEKPVPLTTTKTDNSDSDAVFHLAPPLPSATVAEHFTSLQTSINSHIQRFYTSTPSPFPPSPQQEQQLTPKLQALLSSPETLHAALRIVIANAMLSSILPTSTTLGKSLLPPEVVRCYEVLNSTTTSPAELSKWRHALHALFAPTYTGRMDPRDARKPAINDLTTSLVYTLQPYVIPGFGAVRVRDLERIVSLGAEVGWEMFAHPVEWEVDWESAEREGEVVVFPALVKRSDEQGIELQTKEVVCEAARVEIGGLT